MRISRPRLITLCDKLGLAWLANFIHARCSVSLTASEFSSTFFVQVGSAIGVIVGGVPGDRFALRSSGGRIYVASFGLFACSPFAWALLAVHSLNLLALFSFAFGALGGLFVANLYASAYDVIRESSYGRAAGIMNFIGGFSGAAAVLLAGKVKDQVGISWLMGWMTAGASAVAILLLIMTKLFFAGDRNPDHNPKSQCL